MGKRQLIIFQISFSILSIAFIFYILDWRLILESLVLLNIQSSLISILLTLIALYILSVRWTYITQQTDKKLYPLAKSAYLYSNLYNLMTPANIGGDVYKFFYFKEKDTTDILKKIILERFYGFSSITILCFMCFLLNKRNIHASFPTDYESLILLLLSLIILFLVIYLVFKNIKMLREASRELITLIQHQYITHSYIVVYSFLSLLIWTLSVHVLNLSLGIGANLTEIIFVCLAVELIRFIPISFQGIGVREASFAFFMTGYGYHPESSLALGIVAYAILTICLLISGIVGVYFMKNDG